MLEKMKEGGYYQKCDWEIGPIAQGLKLKLWIAYWEDENGTVPGKHIVSADETFYVQLCWELEGAFKHHFCGKWYVKIDMESIGKAEEFSSECAEIEMDPCRDEPYCHTFEIDASKIKPDECGTVYLVVVTLSSKSPCGDHGHFWGYCKGPSVMFVP